MTTSQRHSWFQGQFDCISVAVFPQECAQQFEADFRKAGLGVTPEEELADVILYDTTHPDAASWRDRVLTQVPANEGLHTDAEEELSELRLHPPILALVNSASEGEKWLCLGAADVFMNGNDPSELHLRLAALLHWKHRQLAMEENLLESRRQSMVMELAGTAAHQLNQPLTCVVGYSDLLLKKMSQEDDKRFFVERIRQEGGRMAKLVKKIGKITIYATKPYVGSSRIIDLNRASVEMSGEFDRFDDEKE